MIWITSFNDRYTLGYNYATMVATMRNIISETIAFIFLLVHDDIVNPSYCKTEPRDNTFVCWKRKKREATVQECFEIEE